jgi:hypothetical protein
MEIIYKIYFNLFFYIKQFDLLWYIKQQNNIKMEMQSINLTKTAGIMLKGEAIISGVNVFFYYNPIKDRFTAISFNIYQAYNVFPYVNRDVPQEYLVGSFISKYIKSNNLI